MRICDTYTEIFYTQTPKDIEHLSGFVYNDIVVEGFAEGGNKYGSSHKTGSRES